LRYLLDTDVISQMIKDHPDPRVDAWFRRTENETMFLSVVTLAELRLGVELLSNGAKKRRLDEWIGFDLMQQFDDRILPIGYDIAYSYARLTAKARKSAFSPGALDTLIAATAVANGMKVATLNRKDFARLGVEMVEF
jgi:predicted nucleic acid-binding protein